jgi:polyisoprenoid-binding protein YceI
MRNRRPLTIARLFIALCAAFAAHAADHQIEIEIDPAKTRIEWTLGGVLHTVHGTFQVKQCRIVYDPDGRRISGEVVVDAASGDSGNGTRDRRMKNDVLETQRFPEARFVPAKLDNPIAVSGSSTARVTGKLDIHGTSHELTVPLKVDIEGSELRAQGSFTIPYVAWGMKDPSTFVLRVEKTVQVQISAVGQVLRSAISNSLQ